jgi:hypothetical protein
MFPICLLQYNNDRYPKIKINEKICYFFKSDTIIEALKYCGGVVKALTRSVRFSCVRATGSMAWLGGLFVPRVKRREQ